MSRVPPLTTAAVEELKAMARAQLSIKARVAHVLLALAAAAMTIVVVSVWLTEPALPVRTHIAFALLTGIGMGWTTFSLWVLRTRRVMLARHRVIAGRLAVTFSSIFMIGCGILGFTGSGRAAWPAFAMAAVLLAVALVLWRRAETAQAALLRRRDLLEREISGRTR